MSAKGKKKGKKEKEPKEIGIDKLNEQKEQRTLEYYQVKVSDLNEKLEKFKLKVENLSKENTTLAKTQAKFYSDKQDIVEFLNIKVGEHEKMISSLESRNRILEDDKKQMDQEYTTKIDQLNKRYQDEIEQLNNQVMKFKTELVELSSFQVQKDEMEEQLKMYKALLERKENEYRETIHNLERKVLQDKSQMKREMLQKVNEAVANFRRVADQQMAETTKRAIRENMSITAQLKKMSSKTVEFITENENLTEKLKKYKTKNALLMDSEKELAKRNFANQKVIRMLVEKLKECDQMLELAFDSQGNVIAQDPFSDPNSEKQYLTPEMIDEIKLLQDDYEVLVSRIKSFDTIGNDLSAFVGEVENALSAGNEKEYKLILDYLQSNLRTITDNMLQLTDFDGVNSNRSDQVAESESDQSFRLIESDMNINFVQQNSNNQSMETFEDDQMIDEYQIQSLQQSQEFDIPENIEESEPSESPFETSQTSLSSHSEAPTVNEQLSIQPITLTPTKMGDIQNDYQKKVHQNFLTMIDRHQNYKQQYIVIKKDQGDGKRTVGVQTNDLKFGPKINTQYLLGEVRPWGQRAEFLPMKSPLYFSRQPRSIPFTENPKKELQRLPPVINGNALRS